MYRELKGRMYSQDVDQRFFAEQIRRSLGYVSESMTGKRPFTIDDAYKICALLEIPVIEIHTFFPPGGKDDTRRPNKRWPY